nr:hypothetical protein [Prochlorococcus marinus]
MERIIVLSNTVGRTFSTPVKTTAIRTIGNYEIISLLTSTECDYLNFVKKVSQTSSNIFVDLEKKQPLNLRNKFDQGGNLFQSILTSVKKLNLDDKLNIYPIKSNDLTVSSIWKQLNYEYGDISGINLGLIGTGNIGSKLIYALTESGVKLKCFNRNINKAISVVNSVLLTKPEHVINSPYIVRRVEQTIINNSGLIVACSDLTENLSDYIYLMPKNFKIFLIGHSLLKENALKIFRNNEIYIQRIDIGKELISYVIGNIYSKGYSVYGKNTVNDNNLCSGGYLGNKNDLIVDDFKNPKWVYAECDGIGGVKYNMAKNDFKSLKEIDDFYNS